MLTAEQVGEIFDAHDGEYLKFDRIPVEERRHSRPDLCAMILLADRIPIVGHPDMVTAAEHDVIYLDGPEDTAEWPLTEADIVYLQRCGVFWDSETASLCMFV